MIIPSLLGAALLAHELLYVTRDGGEYLRRCFVPTIGLQLTARRHCALHLAFMAVSLWMTLQPSSQPAHLAGLALLSTVIASYSLRVSNHLVLGWFMLAAIVMGDAAVALGTGQYAAQALTVLCVQGLVVLTYALSFLHKLNRDFLSLDVSCASQFAEFMCWDRGVRHPRLIRLFQRYAIASTLAFELGIPVLLLVPQTRWFGLLAGLVFHFSLALLGIVNFSAVMYAGLAAFLPRQVQGPWPQSGPPFSPAVIVAMCALTMTIVWLVTPRWAGRYLPYRHRRPAWVIQTCFGLLTAWFVLEALSLVLSRSAAGDRYRLPGPPGLAAALVLLLTLYALNGLAPYLGVKTEFSMAMFSNLRCRGWNHLLFPARWRLFDHARYIVVDDILGLPPAEDLDGAGPAMLAHAVLSRPAEFEYQPYFFFEALATVSRAAIQRAEITVRFRLTPDVTGDVTGETYSVTATPQASAASLRPTGFPAWARLNLFPFVLPLDRTAPHSEQGSVLTRDRSGPVF